MANYFDVRGFSNIASGNNIPHFPSDEDESGDPKYYGLLSHIGSWVIIEHNHANGTFKYIFGKQDYATNWTGRAGLTYKLFNEAYP